MNRDALPATSLPLLVLITLSGLMLGTAAYETALSRLPELPPDTWVVEPPNPDFAHAAEAEPGTVAVLDVGIQVQPRLLADCRELRLSLDLGPVPGRPLPRFFFSVGSPPVHFEVNGEAGAIFANVSREAPDAPPRPAQAPRAPSTTAATVSTGSHGSAAPLGTVRTGYRAILVKANSEGVWIQTDAAACQLAAPRLWALNTLSVSTNGQATLLHRFWLVVRGAHGDPARFADGRGVHRAHFEPGIGSAVSHGVFLLMGVVAALALWLLSRESCLPRTPRGEPVQLPGPAAIALAAVHGCSAAAMSRWLRHDPRVGPIGWLSLLAALQLAGHILWLIRYDRIFDAVAADEPEGEPRPAPPPAPTARRAGLALLIVSAAVLSAWRLPYGDPRLVPCFLLAYSARLILLPALAVRAGGCSPAFAASAGRCCELGRFGLIVVCVLSLHDRWSGSWLLLAAAVTSFPEIAFLWFLRRSAVGPTLQLGVVLACLALALLTIGKTLNAPILPP